MGDFIKLIRSEKLFKEETLKEIEAINDFSKEFHHDTCSEKEQEDTTFKELHGFVKRTLDFINILLK